jgi:copper chaperone CopZ
MSCKSCVARIDRAVRALAGISSVEVELRNGVVRIQHPNVLASQLIERARACGRLSEPSRARVVVAARSHTGHYWRPAMRSVFIGMVRMSTFEVFVRSTAIAPVSGS